MWSIRVELEYETDIHEKALDREKVEKMRNGLHAGDNEPTRAMRETLATRGVAPLGEDALNALTLASNSL